MAEPNSSTGKTRSSKNSLPPRSFRKEVFIVEAPSAWRSPLGGGGGAFLRVGIRAFCASSPCVNLDTVVQKRKALTALPPERPLLNFFTGYLSVGCSLRLPKYLTSNRETTTLIRG